MRRHMLLAGVLGLVVTVSGCSLLGRGGQAQTDPANEAIRELTLHVFNNNFYDATIYAVGGGYRRRLGTVDGNGQRTFRFRWALMELSVEIRLLAVGSTTTHSLPVDAGDVLELRVEPDLHRRIPPSGIG